MISELPPPPDKITILARLSPSGKIIDYIENFQAKAGFPSPAMDYMESNIKLDELLMPNPSSTFLIDVVGQSMINAFISDPAKLIIDRSLEVRNSDIILAVVNGEMTVKYFNKTEGRIFLNPANHLYKAIEIVHGMDFVVWGVVTRIIIEPRAINHVRAGRLQ